MTKATLRMFNGVMVGNDLKVIDPELLNAYNKSSIRKGVLLDPIIYANTPTGRLGSLTREIESHTVSYRDWNNAFYKSWSKLEDLSDFELRRDQILHYLTGYESIGIKSDPFIYYPIDDIELLDFEAGLPVLFIKSLTENEILEKLDNMMSSGVALKPETQDDILTILGSLDFQKILPLIIRCKNKELNAQFAIKFDIVPKNPTEFLRYIITLSTGNSLVIKDKATISAIKMADNKPEVEQAFRTYSKTYGTWVLLAESFHRYKPLWLAFKSYNDLKPVINKIRKLAVKYHKPMSKDLLNDITGMLNRGDDIYQAQFKQALEKANSFRKIRLLYALKTMLARNSEVLYKIRNGKSYATTRKFNYDSKVLVKIYKNLYESIVNDLRKKVEGKLVYLDSNIDYALPATEKQFVGNFPSGTSVVVDPMHDMIVGVHWENFEEKIIDLDLSLIDIDGRKLGWNGVYRNGQAMYSGDVTDASNGASEFFYFKNIENGTYLMNLNFYNSWYTSDRDTEIPFSIIVGQSTVEKISKNYMIDPNEVKLQTSSSIGSEQKILGLVNIEDGKATFYFSESKVGKLNVSSGTEHSLIAQKFMINQLKNSISFKDILLEAGALITYSEEDNPKDIDFDFSAESISKNIILELFY